MMRALILSPLFMAISAFAELTPDKILEKSDNVKMPETTSISFVATVKEYRDRELDRESRYQVLAKGRDSSLINTIFPERQHGRKMLSEGDSLWIYTPDIRRPARVSMQQRLAGEISNGDVARTNFAGDYSAKSAMLETLDGKEVYHLKLQAKRPGVTYSKIDYWVTRSEFQPVKAVFYSVSGKALKTGVYSGLKDVLGKKCVTQLRVTDALDPSRVSVLIYSKHKRVRIPERLLAKESLND